MDQAAWDALTAQGPLVAFTLGVLWMILSGKLVTGREHEATIREHEREYAAMVQDRNLWRDLAIPAVRGFDEATRLAQQGVRDAAR